MTQKQASNALLSAALTYAEEGWRVFPIKSSQKKPPLISAWPSRATTDRRQIKEWWKKWPTANVGVATGAASGIVVVDVDRKTDGFRTLRKLCTRNGALPPTLVADTPNGGRHYFFRSDVKVRTSAGVLGKGIDIRGEGGYVVVSPSRLSGGRYAWRD